MTPPAFCREAAEVFRGTGGYQRVTRFGGISTEPDFSELHVTRLVAGDAGLIRKHQGRFKLTRECRRLLGEGGPRAVYPRLFRTYVQRFNWAYADGYPELPFIQQSFLFTLYLLRQHGAEERPHTFYEDAYLRAFPALLQEIAPSPYSSPEREARDCYTLRTLDRFAAFLGLAAVRELSKDILNRDCRITKRPLLEQAVRFHL